MDHCPFNDNGLGNDSDSNANIVFGELFSFFRINVSVEIQFVHVLLSCACSFSFYEKVQPFPGIMTLNMVGPMVTLLFFKVPLYFK